MKAHQMFPGMVYTDHTQSHFIICDVKDADKPIVKVKLSAGRTDPGDWYSFVRDEEVHVYPDTSAQ